MMSPLHNASVFLIQSVFDFYLFVLLLRLLLQYLRVDYYNPVTQFIIKITSPVVVPLRRVIPGYWGIDLATVVLILIVSLMKLSLISVLSIHHFPNIFGLILWSLGDLLGLIIKLFFYAILASVIISWVAPSNYSPLFLIVQRLTDPLLKPARRLIPQIAGFDISPIPVLLLLQILIILMAEPLAMIGYQWVMRSA
jgi:YggT family protein